MEFAPSRESVVAAVRENAVAAVATCAVGAVVYKALAAVRRLGNSKHVLARQPREACHVEGPSPHPLFAADTYVNAQGLRLFVARTEVPAGVKTKATVYLSHGLNEHAGRYARFREALAARGYAVVAPDHQGHGRSEGCRAYVERFGHYVDDVLAVAKRAADPDLPLFIVGHSMGGQIAIHAAGRGALPNLRGLVLSAPATMPDPEFATPFMRGLAKALGDLLPKLELDGLPSAYLTRDATVIDQYVNDPLVNLGGIRARWGAEFLAAMPEGFEVAENQTGDVGLYVVHGGDDRLVTIEGSRALVAAWGRGSASTKKNATLYEIPENFHEVLNEPDRDATTTRIVAWLDAQL